MEEKVLVVPYRIRSGKAEVMLSICGNPPKWQLLHEAPRNTERSALELAMASFYQQFGCSPRLQTYNDTAIDEARYIHCKMEAGWESNLTNSGFFGNENAPPCMEGEILKNFQTALILAATTEWQACFAD